MHNWANPNRTPGGNKHFRFWDFKVMGRGSDGYDVRVIFQSRTPATWGRGAEQLIVTLSIEGDEFQIVGHRSLSAGEGREAAVDQAPATPEQVAAMEAVERLLREREEAFREKLWIYTKENFAEDVPYHRGLAYFVIHEFRVLEVVNGTYSLHVSFDANTNSWKIGKIVAILFIEVHGEDFEIVGHEFPSDEGRRPAARSPATPEQQAEMEAVERLLREREAAFRLKLRDYNDAHQIQPVTLMKSRNFRLYEMNVLGMAKGAYKVRVVFDPYVRKSGAVDVVVFVTIEGDDFEIVGHEFLSAAAQ